MLFWYRNYFITCYLIKHRIVHFPIFLSQSNKCYVCRVYIFHKALSPTSDSDLRRSSDAFAVVRTQRDLFPAEYIKDCVKRDSRKKRRKEKKKKQFGNISGRTDQKHSNEFRLVMHEISPWTKEEFNKAAKLLIKHVGGDGAFVSLSAAEPSLKCEEGLRQFL